MQPRRALAFVEIIVLFCIVAIAISLAIPWIKRLTTPKVSLIEFVQSLEEYKRASSAKPAGAVLSISSDYLVTFQFFDATDDKLNKVKVIDGVQALYHNGDLTSEITLGQDAKGEITPDVDIAFLHDSGTIYNIHWTKTGPGGLDSWTDEGQVQ